MKDLRETPRGSHIDLLVRMKQVKWNWRQVTLQRSQRDRNHKIPSDYWMRKLINVALLYQSQRWQLKYVVRSWVIQTSLTCRRHILKQLRLCGTGIHYHACVRDRHAERLRPCVSACGWCGKNKYVGLQREKTGLYYKSSQTRKECLTVTGQLFNNS